MSIRMLTSYKWLLVAFGAVALLLPSVRCDAARALAITDANGIVDIGPPKLSPTATVIAVELDGRIHVMPAEGGPMRAVTSASSTASEPTWSTDGSSLYFLSDRSGSMQIWKLPVDAYGEAEQLTDFELPVSGWRLSPDGTRVLLARTEQHADALTEGKTTPWVIDRLQFKEDAGDGYITGDNPQHFFVHELSSHEEVAATAGRYSNDEAAWSPDGRAIVFVSNREAEPDASYRGDLWLQSLDDGAALAPTRLTDDEEPKFAPAFSPDGKWIAFISAVDGVYGVQGIALVPAAGGPVRRLTAGLDRWVSDFRFSADGRSILFIFDQEGAQHLGRVDTATGRIETLIGGERVVSAFDVAADGTVVVRARGADTPDELYAFRDGGLDRLTGINDNFVAAVELGRKFKLAFKTGEGGQADAFVTLPPSYRKGQRYPALLRIHGGPVSQFTHGYEFVSQLLATNGYVVIEPNPRGSTGRGQQFINAIHSRWGDPDFDDLMSAVDAVVAAGYADPERLGVFGYSYGGFMTNVIITRTQRFRAAVSGAGHSLILANYGHDIYQRWYNWELGPPWDDPAAYASLSPLLRVAEVRTPTLFFGGRDDWNVPILNAELFFQSLRQRGVPTRLVVYPETHHGGWRDEFTADYLTRLLDWFGRYVLEEQPAESP